MAKPSAASSRSSKRTQKITVRFGTNRDQTSDDKLFGSDFRKVPPLFLTGTIDVYHRGGTPDQDWVPDGKSLHIDPVPKAASSSIPEAVAAAPSTADAMTAFIDVLLQAHELGIVFLPGFASTFKDAMSSSAQIASAYGVNQIFCFSWPSQGEFGASEYFKDRDSTYESGGAIAASFSTGFSKLLSIEKPSRPNLRIVCHSMGNRALSAAIQHISLSAPKLLSATYFKYALLMAADEDDNALDEPNKLKSLLTLADQIDVYTNEWDAAMFLSNLANGRRPLGWLGPVHFGQLPNRVIWIDCTDVGATGFSDWGHQYFRNSQPVTADVHQVLQGLPPDRVAPRIPDRKFPRRKFVIPFSTTSAWARARGY